MLPLELWEEEAGFQNLVDVDVSESTGIPGTPGQAQPPCWAPVCVHSGALQGCHRPQESETFMLKPHSLQTERAL